MISNDDVATIQPAVHAHSFAMRNADTAQQLVAGIYGVESNKWRWTARDFSVLLAAPRGASTRGANLVFAFYIPDEIVRRTGPVTLTAYFNGAEVGARTYQAAGVQRFSTPIQAVLLKQSPVVVAFHLDRYVAKGVLENRELGVIADTIGLESE